MVGRLWTCVYFQSCWSVWPVSWLVVSADGCNSFVGRPWRGMLVQMQGIPDRIELLHCVPRMRGLSICWLDGDWISGEGRGWCGWASDRQPTHTNLYLYQKSHHHPANKYSVLSSLVHRAKALCDQEPLASELTFLTKVLQQNGGSVFRVPLSTVYLEPRKEGLGLVDVKTKCITFSLDQYI